MNSSEPSGGGGAFGGELGAAHSEVHNGDSDRLNQKFEEIQKQMKEFQDKVDQHGAKIRGLEEQLEQALVTINRVLQSIQDSMSTSPNSSEGSPIVVGRQQGGDNLGGATSTNSQPNSPGVNGEGNNVNNINITFPNGSFPPITAGSSPNNYPNVQPTTSDPGNTLRIPDNAPVEAEGGQENQPAPPTISPLERALEEMRPALDRARDAYALETAKDRKKFWSRFLESDSPFFSRFIKRVPPLKSIADFVNKRLTNHADMDRARGAYERVLERAQRIGAQISKQEADKILRQKRLDLSPVIPGSPEEAELDQTEQAMKDFLQNKILEMITTEDASLEGKIVHYRGEKSGKATRFSDWWARQKGFLGGIKKAFVTVGAGAIIGGLTATGLAIVPLAIPGAVLTLGPTIAGGLGGLKMGLGLNDKLANSHIDKDKTKTVALDHSEKDLVARSVSYSDKLDGVGYGDLADQASVVGKAIVTGVESRTARVAKDNRNRLATTALQAGFGGFKGGEIANELMARAGDFDWKNPFDRGGDSVKDAPPTDSAPKVDIPGGTDFGSYDYPWSWAKDVFGEQNAMNQLFDLAQRAQEAGYNIQWNNLGDGNMLNDWISINGRSDTGYVISILSQFIR